jgi:flagellar basal body-associated protein FliL
MYRQHCYHAPSPYLSSLHALSTPTAIVAHDRILQFPFVSSNANEATEEELERRAKKREEATNRLREHAAKQREEKLERHQEELTAFGELKEQRGTMPKTEYDVRAVLSTLVSQRTLTVLDLEPAASLTGSWFRQPRRFGGVPQQN